jgi:hypothetical protein
MGDFFCLKGISDKRMYCMIALDEKKLRVLILFFKKYALTLCYIAQSNISNFTNRK